MSSRSATKPGNREAKLEMIRRQNAADARRRRVITLVTVGIIVVLVAVVGFVIFQAAQDEADQAGADPGNLTAVTVGQDDTEVQGFAVGPEDADATVVLYEDYFCPGCQAFEQQAGTYVDELPSQGVRVVYHPVAILDRVSQGTEYSTRSASAAACVAQEDDEDLTAFKAFSDLLFLNQPQEGTQGLSSSQLADYAVEAGAPESVRQCIEDDAYSGWADRSTEAAQEAGLSGTPFVTVNGEPVEPSQQGIQAAIEAAGGTTGADPSAEPSAAPEASTPAS